MTKQASAKISIKRNKSLWGAAYPITLRINGKKYGMIRIGQEKTFDVPPGEKFIQVKMFKGIFLMDSKTFKTPRLHHGQKIILECGIRNVIKLYIEQNEPIINLFKDGVFISYRRIDSNNIAGRIYDKLIGQFGEATVFKDTYSIEYGDNFLSRIEDALSGCKILIPVIGNNWLKKGKKRFFDNSNDFVKLEIQTAINNGLKILPVFVNSGKMPSVEDLPNGIEDLAFFNGLQIRDDPDFANDVEDLIAKIKEILK